MKNLSINKARFANMAYPRMESSSTNRSQTKGLFSQQIL